MFLYGEMLYKTDSNTFSDVEADSMGWGDTVPSTVGIRIMKQLKKE